MKRNVGILFSIMISALASSGVLAYNIKSSTGWSIVFDGHFCKSPYVHTEKDVNLMLSKAKGQIKESNLPYTIKSMEAKLHGHTHTNRYVFISNPTDFKKLPNPKVRQENLKKFKTFCKGLKS